MASVSSVSIHKHAENRRKSCDTVCSSNSSCFLQKRKPAHPLACSVRTNTRSSSNVGQRVLSAKLLRFRSMQNQLNDANFHLVELARENRALKTLQDRQDKALAKYEGQNADLPKILLAHEEEVRILQERNRFFRKQVKDLNDQLKIKEDELLNARDQLKHLTELSKDKHLLEREKMREEVENLKELLQKSENQVNLLNRKLILEEKAARYRLHTEEGRHKHTQRELRQALQELDKLSDTNSPGRESRAKVRTLNRKKIGSHLPQRQAVSMVSLENTRLLNGENSDEPEKLEKSTAENVKLDQIVPKKSSMSISSVLKSPTDNIIARLSSGSLKDVDQLSSTVEQLSLSNGTRTHTARTIHTISINSRPTSSQKLDKLESIIDLHMKKSTEKAEVDESDELMGELCRDLVTDARICTKNLDFHKDTLGKAQMETDELVEKIKTTDKLNSKLQRDTNLMLSSSIDLNNVDGDDSNELISQILKEEYMFQAHVLKADDTAKKYDMLIKSTDKNGNLTRNEQKVTLEEKKKLLETLKAIDNGENVELSVNEMANRRHNLMKELFGDNSY